MIRCIKTLLPFSLLVSAMMLSGCAWIKHFHHRKTEPAPSQSQFIVTPDASLQAKVLRVNTVGRFVVLNFPDGRMPKLDEHLFLYRGGLKTAEVKVVGPEQDTSIVADIVSGDAQPGDTVRDQ